MLALEGCFMSRLCRGYFGPAWKIAACFGGTAGVQSAPGVESDYKIVVLEW
jgi:hypothetical protein